MNIKSLPKEKRAAIMLAVEMSKVHLSELFKENVSYLEFSRKKGDVLIMCHFGKSWDFTKHECVLKKNELTEAEINYSKRYWFPDTVVDILYETFNGYELERREDERRKTEQIRSDT